MDSIAVEPIRFTGILTFLLADYSGVAFHACVRVAVKIPYLSLACLGGFNTSLRERHQLL